MTKAALLLMAASCATTSDRRGAGQLVAFDRARVDGTLARILDLSHAGKTAAQIHERYGEQYVTGVEGNGIRVTVWAEPEREVTASRLAIAVERVGGVVLEGTEGEVRARLSLDQVGTLSRDPSVRKLRLTRHHDPIR